MLSKNGFLSSEIEEVEREFEKEFNFIYEKVRQYNQFFQESTFKFVVKRNMLQHWCLAAFYLRSLSLYQSIFILCKKGITGESNILLRSLYEIKFIVVALSKYPSLVTDYLGQEAIEMKRILKNSKKWKDNYPKGISLQEIEEKIKEIESEIATHKIKRKTIKYFAEKADLLDDYELYYSILCLAGHSNIYDLKKHFRLDSNGIIETFNWGPNKNHTTKILGISTETMFSILHHLIEVFSLQIDEEFDLYLLDYQENFKKFRKHI